METNAQKHLRKDSYTNNDQIVQYINILPKNKI